MTLPQASVLAAAALLALCGQAAATEARYAYSRGTKLTARFSAPDGPAGSVVLTFANVCAITLSQVMSADGGRYAGDRAEFWIKGRGAVLTRGSRSETCSTP